MRIGRYTLEGELGRGGMGVVYRARGPHGQELALKLLSNQRGDRAERFAREARLQEQLGEGAGFVPLLDLGTSPAGPYLVMPLLSGGTLRERLQGPPMSVSEAALLGLELAEALGRAHAVGVVHRDVKPDNVLFTSEGRPLIADLGLAKHFRHDLDGASLSVALSRGGEMRGTLGYMAPEQLRDAKAAGPPADVFALGVVLYEVLAGHQPFEAESYMELLARVAGGQKDPLPDSCPTWLAAVVDRALDPDPERRYPDGASLAEALRAQVAPRRRWGLWLGLGALLVLGLGLGVSSALGTSPAPSPSPSHTPTPKPPRYPAAWQAFLESEELRLTGEWQLRAPALALAPKDSGGVVVADPTLVSCVDAPRDAPTTAADQVAWTLPHETPARGAVLAGRVALSFGAGLVTHLLDDGTQLGAHAPEEPVPFAYLEPKGDYVFAAIGGELVRTTTRSFTRPFVVARLDEVIPSAVAATSDRTLIASRDQAILLDELGRPLASLQPGSKVSGAVFWSDPPRPLLMTQSGALHFFKPEGGPSGDPLTTLLESPRAMCVVAGRGYLIDSQRLLVADLSERRVLETLDLSGLGDPLQRLGVSPEGRFLAVSTEGGRLLRFERRTPLSGSQPGLPRLSWGDPRARHVRTATGLALAGEEFVSAGVDGRIHLWDPETGGARRSIDAGPGILRLRQAGPARALTVSGYAVRLWDLERGREALRLPLTFFPIDAGLSPSGDRVAVIGSAELEVWALPARTRLLRTALEGPRAPRRVLYAGPDRILLGLRSGKVQACDAKGEPVWEHSVGARDVEELQLHLEGSAVLTGSEDGTITSRHLTTGEERWRIETEGAVSSLSTDERQLLVGLRLGRLELWELEGLTRRWRRDAPGGPQTVARLVSGGQVLSGGSNGLVTLSALEPPHAERWKRGPGHVGPVLALSFSADSSRIIAVGKRAARGWSASTGEALEFVSADRIIDAAAGTDLAVVANFAPPLDRSPKTLSCALEYLGVAPGKIRRGRPVAASGVDVDELAISADGNVIALTNRSTPSQIMLLTRSGTPSVGLNTGIVTRLRLSPQGRLLAIRTTRGFEIWGIQPVKRLLQIEKVPGHFGFLPTKPPRIALSERLGEVTVVDPIGRQVLGSFQPATEVEGLAGTPRGEVVLLLEGGAIEVWEPGAKAPHHRFRLDDPHDRPTSLAVNATGRLLAVGTGRGRIAIFDLPE